MDLSFVVIGKAATKGSTTSRVAKYGDGQIVYKNGHPVVITHDASGSKGKTWAGAVANGALVARAEAQCQLARSEPMGVDVVFYEPRPKSHFGSGRNARCLLASAPVFPAKRPDVDKLLRAILDPLTGVLWGDDGQVVKVSGTKLYGEPARAEIQVWTVLSAEVQVAPGEQEQLALAS